MRFLLVFFFLAAPLIGACSAVTDSSVSVDPSSSLDVVTGTRPYAGRVTSDPPGIDCVLAGDGSHSGSCAMTMDESRPVILKALGDPGSGVTGWVNASDGSDMQGPLFVSGPSLLLAVHPGMHPVWAVAFGPAPP
ncbi:MAG TPA: hypothetical protein VIF62_20500 [Labilithrix sp.]